MTGKERIMASLKGRPVDHLCWSPLIDRYFIRSLPEQGYKELSVPDAVRLIKADVMQRHCPVVKLTYDSTIEFLNYTEGAKLIEIINTPAGKLITEKIIHESSGREHIIKFPVENAENVKTLTYIVEHSRYERNYSAYYEAAKLIGDDGIATAEGPTTPIQVFLMDVCGLEKTVYLLMDNEEIVNECFNAIEKQNQQAYELMAEGPAEVIISYENTSSTVISPSYYQKYCDDSINNYADICHKNQKIFITHMCGKLSVFSGYLCNGRQDGIDSVCPPSTGDMWAFNARKEWGENKIIIGGIEPPQLAQMTVEQTKEYINKLLNKMPNFNRFILSTGDATSYGTPIENLLAVSEIVTNYHKA